MDQKEIERNIHELEERLDRLRTLYEQYFLGFEKLEPQVPRKDVERRFAILRKEQIRNTAVRFRFNVATQKFNTYSMYWGRICRQIEEGTYKRHLARAEKRFGRAAVRGLPDIEIDVDIDMAELEAADMDAVLAEADAHAERIARDDAPDTVPPPPPSAPLSQSQLANGAVMRPAALPAGVAKPRVVLRKIAKPGEAVPEAPPSVPAPAPKMPASPVRPPMQSAPDLGSQRKIIVRPRMPSAADGSISGRMPAAPPAPPPSSDRGSPGKMTAAPTSSPRFPMPPPPASVRRIPAAPSSSQNMPPAPDSEPSGQKRKSVPPQKVRVPLPSQLGRTTKKD